MSITHAFAADITKAERDANGDLIVYGKATGPDLDLDKQVCDPAWLKQAMPEWMTWGNLREMHQPIAAGVGLELAAQGDDWMVKSKCVDEGTAKKIETGVLKGYSVGIRNAQVVKDASAPGGRIVGGSIVEVSYVDRPCNPTATLAIAKAATLDKGAPLLPVDAEGDLLEGIEDWPVEDQTGEDEGEQAAKPQEAKASLDGGEQQAKGVRTMTDRELAAIIQKAILGARKPEPSDRDKAVALVTKAIGPDGQVDETADIEGGRQAIALIAGLIKMEADELAAGHLDEAFDISLLVNAVECLKCWLQREQADAAGAETDDGIAYVALAAKFGYTPAEVDALPAEMKTALAELAKRDFSAKERDAAAGDGQAMSDGSFPIKTKGDLKNAIRAVGRAKDPAKAKAHIKARARALGATDLLPDDWKDVDPDVTKTTDAAPAVSKDEVNDLVKAAVTEATKAAQERVDALAAELAKVKATPLPGGPVITATATRQQTNGADQQKAAYYEAMADQVQDPTASAGYRQKAADLRKAAAGQSQ